MGLHFIEIINGLVKHAPKTKMMFNRNPVTNIEAVQRNFPLTGCENKPGVNYVSPLHPLATIGSYKRRQSLNYSSYRVNMFTAHLMYVWMRPTVGYLPNLRMWRLQTVWREGPLWGRF